MKKFLLKTLIALSAAIAVCSLPLIAGCENDGAVNQSDKGSFDVSYAAAFTAKESVIHIDESTSVKDYMDALKEAGRLDFEGSDGQYGFFITTLSGVTPDSNKREYWAFYTTLVEMDGVTYSDTATTFIYDGVTMYYSMNGVSYTPCVAGESYAIVLQTY